MRKCEQTALGEVMFDMFEPNMVAGFYDDYGEEKVYSEDEDDEYEERNNYSDADWAEIIESVQEAMTAG